MTAHLSRARRISALLLLAAHAALLAGCFSVTEEIRVRANLSGSYSVDLGVAESVASLGDLYGKAGGKSGPQAGLEKLKDELQTQDFVTAVKLEEELRDDLRHFVLSVEASDMARLGGYLAEKSGESGYRFSYSLERSGPLRFEFEKRIRLTAPEGLGAGGFAAPGDGGGGGGLLGGLQDQLGRLASGALFNGMTYTVRLYAPSVSADGAGRVADGAGVEWRIPLGDLISEGHAGRTLHAGFTAHGLKDSVLLGLIGAVALLIAVPLALAVSRRKRRGGKQADAETAAG